MKLLIEEVPEVSDGDVAIGSNFGTNKDLLEKAETNLSSLKWYEVKISTIFFKGGSMSFNPENSDEYNTRLTRYLKAYMQSFDSKHEHKTLVCALLLYSLEN